MQVISTERIPIKLWLDDMEDGALDQAKNLANLPFAFKHVAIMPDSHQGYGMPIGGVLATKGVIIPNAVGVDIGCGMCAVKTNIRVNEFETETLKKIMGLIRESVPVGFAHQKEKQSMECMPILADYITGEDRIVNKEYEKALTQVGTLGGGNHFIEIQKGSDGHVWIMIHSGSRNLGLQVANHYNKLAVQLNDKWHSSVPEKWELAYLPTDSDEGNAYIEEMKYCVAFALVNRKLMMDKILKAFEQIYPYSMSRGLYVSSFRGEPMINIAHNYASLENHFGENVFVHRKGATLASKDTVGIIPGSMGTSSYIVKGRGNPESFNSCSHGAGRRMGRKQAIRTLNLEDEMKKMEGIVHGIRSTKDLDEAPGSYKDITTVMDNQTDLVDMWIQLKPLGVVKG